MRRNSCERAEPACRLRVNLILARPGLDDARAAGFVQAMQAAGDDLAAALPQAAFSTLNNTLASAPEAGLLHPVLRGMRQAT